MGKVATIGLAFVTIVVVFLVVVGSSFIGYRNDEVRLRKQVEAQQLATQAVFDQTWKIIAQQAQVADQYKDAFAKIYPDLMEGRYGNERGGALLSFVQESNPNFDVSLYKQLSSTIEAQRISYTREQRTLIDLKREHDTLLSVFPGSLFLMGIPEIKITVITSDKTKDIYKTGNENDINLFLK